MTSYAILTLVKAGGEENLMMALNAVKWISKQRNGQGGFVSTQVMSDTKKYNVILTANFV
jgi:heme-binding NEAT domain protein